ncbi:MAG: VOC family protein [Vicinamibacterales bacterium]|jgi:glyoxylase I family protein|nr:VOC family protein [Vicinamibacterales bacterium]
MIRGIEHTAIASPEPARLAAWYVDTLGFHVNHRGNTAVFVKAPDGSMVEIIQAEGSRGDATLKTPGLRHLALTVDDFDADLARLRASGATLLAEPQDSKGTRVVFFADPEGNVLHLIQRPAPLP